MPQSSGEKSRRNEEKSDIDADVSRPTTYRLTNFRTDAALKQTPIRLTR
jgi:hypothetical protein